MLSFFTNRISAALERKLGVTSYSEFNDCQSYIQVKAALADKPPTSSCPFALKQLSGNFDCKVGVIGDLLIKSIVSRLLQY